MLPKETAALDAHSQIIGDLCYIMKRMASLSGEVSDDMSFDYIRRLVENETRKAHKMIDASTGYFLRRCARICGEEYRKEGDDV